MRKGFLSIWVSVGAVLVSAFVFSHTLADAGKPPVISPIKYKRGEFIVKLKNGKATTKSSPLKSSQSNGFAGIADAALGVQTHALFTDLGENHKVSVLPFKNDKSLVKIKVEDQVGTTDFLEEVQNNPNVEYAEPNFIYHTMDA